MNAAISASVVLASRLPSNQAVFALTVVSIQFFALFPLVRRQLQVCTLNTGRLISTNAVADILYDSSYFAHSGACPRRGGSHVSNIAAYICYVPQRAVVRDFRRTRFIDMGTALQEVKPMLFEFMVELIILPAKSAAHGTWQLLAFVILDDGWTETSRSPLRTIGTSYRWFFAAIWLQVRTLLATSICHLQMLAQTALGSLTESEPLNTSHCYPGNRLVIEAFIAA